MDKKARPECCNCDYCSSTKTRRNSKSNQNLDSYKSNTNCLVEFNQIEKKSYFQKTVLQRSQSFGSLNAIACSQKCKLKTSRADLVNAEYDYDHELIDKRKSTHNFCFYYYNLWKGEMFKARAFEKQNEKLESRVKYLENKLEKETYQQIRISLEWRKNVTKLVDENTRLKMAVFSKIPHS